MSRGKLVLFEGLDRTGKTTQSDILVERLQPDVTLIKFPERSTEIGALIDRYLKDKTFELPDQAVHLLFSANRWEMAERIKQLLLQGTHVVLDRYVYSGIAYSAAKHTDKMDRSWCLQPDRGLPRPDLTIFLTSDDAENELRAGFGEERYEKSEFQQEVKRQFIEVFKALEDNSQEQNLVQIINITGKSVEQVANEVWELTEPVVRAPTDSKNTEILYF
ncbi:hypothetical protein HG537_0H04190 [Torulaspora globosa]|uniref:Thymidylate kinase n=1 Tax=Torulaspora globosa TaxID=48254 RepID=A0A7H9I1D4_9SACH|nr:hypothetical protein HG537_0H04190 [Torulaspora sp. CBS 2947]